MAKNPRERDEKEIEWDRRPLEPHEIEQVRIWLRQYEALQNTWLFARRIAFWGVGTFGAIYAFREPLGKIIKALQ